MRKLFYLILLAGLAALPTDLVGQFSLATTSQGGNGTTGSSFQITALRTVRIHRLWIQPYSSGTITPVVWAKPGATTSAPTISIANGWSNPVPGTLTLSGVTANQRVQIPVDLNIIILAGQTYSFYVGGGNTAYTTNANPFIYADNNISINIQGYGGGIPNPTIAYRGYNGQVDYFTLGAVNDAAVVSIDSVSASCPGTQDIWTTIANQGSNQIDSVTVNWSWNGAVQTPIQLVTLLDTFNGTGNTSAPVFLGSRAFAAGQFYNVKVWTSNPNGVADTVNFNDTLSAAVGASLSGTYTINSGAASGGINFNSFTDAVDALNAFGVCGPTTFIVVPNSGPYKEQISIDEITGASSVNTITFNGGISKEEIWVDAAMTSTTDRHVIRLNGADWVTLKNLTINNKAAAGAGTTYGTGVHITNEADHNIIEDCLIDVDAANQQTSGNFCGIQMAGQFATTTGANGSHNIIRNNKVHGGYYGITVMGSSTASYEENNVIENNEVTDTWYYNMYCYYQSGLQVKGNLLTHRNPGNTFGYGILAYYQDTLQIVGNTIIDPIAYGMLLGYNRAPGTTTPSGFSYVVNNSIGGEFLTTAYGLYFTSYATDVKVYHNSVSMNATASAPRAVYVASTLATGLDIQNNSFAVFNSTGGHAMWTNASSIATMDYNNYYNNGDTSNIIYIGGNIGLGAMRGAGGFNAASYHGDPQYIDNLTNLHSKGSQLWDRGNASLGISEDIDGDVRPGFGGLIPDIGSDEFQPPQWDITPAVMLSPTLPICPGSFNVVIDVQNLGQQTIDTFTVSWTVNGVAQTPFVATSAGMATNTGTTVSLGTLTIAGNTPYDIVFITSRPNNRVDEDLGNDTLGFYGLRTGLAAGNYIINKNLPTAGVIYNSFQDAVDDLNDFGICGSVTFIVAPNTGPYEEQIILGEVVGTSATSTITFDGGPTQEEIFADSVTNSNQRAVITIDGGDWITIKNLKVSNHAPATGTWYNFGVHLLNGANNNTVDGCKIEVDSAEVSTSSFRAALVLSATTNSPTSSGNTGEYNTFQNNTIHGGYYGVTMFGGNSTDHRKGNKVLNNKISGAYYYGMMNYYQDEYVVEGNTIELSTGSTNTFGYAMYIYYCDGIRVAKNQILNPRYMAMYMYGNNYNNPATTSTFENNMIMGEWANTTRYGIYMSSYNHKINFFHNSISIPYDNGYPFRTVSTTGIDSLDVRNNSFAVFGNGGYPVYLLDSTQVMEMNYNNYYSYDGNVAYMNNTAFDNTNYRGAGTWNIASRFGDPGYIDNFKNLHALSAQLWNAGNNQVGVPDDIDGDVRPDSFIVDIGADEFRPPAHEAGFVGFIEPVSACGYSAASSVTVEFQNAGLEPVDTISLSYRVNGGTIVTETATYNPAILSGATGIYTFTATANLLTPGRYLLDGWVDLDGDNITVNDSLTGFEVWHDANVNTFPYFEDFEAGPGGWRAGGNGNWQWGLPRGINIDTAASGVKAWMTDTATNYQNNECSWLLSPCYDFTNLNLPFIRMFISYDSEPSWDGTQIQATTDSGKTWNVVGDVANTSGTQINWYTGTSIGLGTCLAGTQEGWLGRGTGWIQAEISLQPYANEPDVRFRFFFGSDGSVNVGYDGFAVDDIEIGDVPPNDLGVVKLLEPNKGACGDSNMVVSVVVKNFGSLEQYNYPVTVVVTDSPNVPVTTFTVVSPDTIFPGQTDTVFMGTFNTYAGGQYTFVSYTSLTGDLDRTNDTLVVANVDITPIPGPPSVVSPVSCAPDSFVLRVMNPDTLATYAWYDTRGSSTPISFGDTFQTPLLSTSRDYYVGTFAALDDTITTTFIGGNGQSGNMFDLTNISGSAFTIDSLAQNLQTTGAVTMEMYFVTNRTTYVGKETDPTQWTQVGSANVTGAGTGNATSVPIGGFTIFPGETVGIYVTTTNSTVAYTNGAFTYSNNDMEINTGVGISYPFGSIFNPRTWNGTLFYSGAGCPSELAKVSAIISPITAPNLGPDNVVCGGFLLDAGAGYANYSWNNGSTTQQNLVTASGTYNVLVSDVNGCTGADTINLIVNANPIVNLGPDVTVCGSILLDAGNPGATWTWQNGTVSQTFLAAATNQYTVNVTDNNGCETRDTINVRVNPLPPLDLGVDRVECDSVVLDAMNPGLPVVWSDMSTNQTLSVKTSGSYSVTVTDPATNCAALDTVNLTINISPAVDLGPDGDYCDILILDAQNPGSLYNWSTGDLSQTVIVTNNNEGTINVEVTDINGCAGKDTITVNIVDQPVIGFNTAANTPNMLDATFTNTSTGENITYMWDFGDGNSATTRNAVHTYAVGGTYTVTLTIANACDTLKQTFTVAIAGVGIGDDLLSRSINLFPNPTTDMINININGLNEDVEVTVADATGRILFQDLITRFEQANTTRYDLSDEAKGVYTLMFKMGDRRLARRVVLK